MANPLDTDAGSELFSSYEADLRLVQADLGQKLDQIPELAGEPRKALIRQAQHCVDEASELVRLILKTFIFVSTHLPRLIIRRYLLRISYLR